MRRTSGRFVVGLLLALTLGLTGNAVAGCLTLIWTAPGDPAKFDRASAYDLRVLTVPITSTNWNQAVRLYYTPAPQMAGNLEYMQIAGLTPGVKYYFAIRASDPWERWSAISNVVTATMPTTQCVGFYGNVDCDPWGIVNIADLTMMIDHLFISMKPMCCAKAGNVDLDPNGDVSITDLTELVTKLFIVPGTFPRCP